MAVKHQNAIVINLTVSGQLNLSEEVKAKLAEDLLVDLEDRVTVLVDQHLEVVEEGSVEVDIEWEPAPRIDHLPADARVKDVVSTVNDLIDSLRYAGLMAGDTPEGDPEAAGEAEAPTAPAESDEAPEQPLAA